MINSRNKYLRLLPTFVAMLLILAAGIIILIQRNFLISGLETIKAIQEDLESSDLLLENIANGIKMKNVLLALGTVACTLTGLIAVYLGVYIWILREDKNQTKNVEISQHWNCLVLSKCKFVMDFKIVSWGKIKTDLWF